MTIQQVFENAIKSTVSAFLKIEEKNNFPAPNPLNPNLGSIKPNTPLVVTQTRGPQETPSYQLAPNAKPSDLIRGLISGKYSCHMTCQMVHQLCWYHAMLLTLTSNETLGESKGTAVFDKLLTEVFPFVLRDYVIGAGMPLIAGGPFTSSRGMFANIVLHPLMIFRSQKLTTPEVFEIGDAVIFTNFSDFSVVATQALSRSRKADRSGRRMAALYLGNNDSNNATYYAFETGSSTNTKEDIAEHLTQCMNHNLALIGSREQRNSKTLLNLEYFYQAHTHEHFNLEMLNFLIHDPETAFAQIKEFHEVLTSQIAKINKITDASTVEMMKNMRKMFAEKGSQFMKDNKFAQAVEAFSLAAANSVRAYESANSTSAALTTAEELSDIYYNLACCYKSLEKPLLARLFFEMTVNLAINVDDTPTAAALNGLEQMNDLIKAKSGDVNNSQKPSALSI